MYDVYAGGLRKNGLRASKPSKIAAAIAKRLAKASASV